MLNLKKYYLVYFLTLSFIQEVSVEDVVKAIEVTEEEIDEEVSRAVRSSARPGRVHKVK